jgi:hypothetical protein
MQFVADQSVTPTTIGGRSLRNIYLIGAEPKSAFPGPMVGLGRIITSREFALDQPGELPALPCQREHTGVHAGGEYDYL